jgi:hypothetical protein
MKRENLVALTRIESNAGEYRVKAYNERGERLPAADYFTNDRTDAGTTAALMVKSYKAAERASEAAKRGAATRAANREAARERAARDAASELQSKAAVAISAAGIAAHVITLESEASAAELFAVAALYTDAARACDVSARAYDARGDFTRSNVLTGFRQTAEQWRDNYRRVAREVSSAVNVAAHDASAAEYKRQSDAFKAKKREAVDVRIAREIALANQAEAAAVALASAALAARDDYDTRDLATRAARLASLALTWWDNAAHTEKLDAWGKAEKAAHTAHSHAIRFFYSDASAAERAEAYRLAARLYKVEAERAEAVNFDVIADGAKRRAADCLESAAYIIAAELDKHAETRDGFTANAETGELVMPARGFAVSIREFASFLELARFYESGEAAKLVKLACGGRSAAYAGFWRDSQTGKSYVDLTVILLSETDAFLLGRLYGQKAVWNFERGEEIRLDAERFRVHGTSSGLTRRFHARADSESEAYALARDYVRAVDGRSAVIFAGTRFVGEVKHESGQLTENPPRTSAGTLGGYASPILNSPAEAVLTSGRCTVCGDTLRDDYAPEVKTCGACDEAESERESAFIDRC